MSDSKVYYAPYFSTDPIPGGHEVVSANDYRAAQSQLAAAQSREMAILAAMETANADLAALREELAKFDEGMRAMACSLGAGGYNAETMTADQLVGKVQWGIDNIITVQEQRLADAERRNRQLEILLRRASNYGGLTPEWHDAVQAALNPNPEAASHDK